MAICFPPAIGVPFAGGPPIWWDATGSVPALNDRADDPRWRGSTRRGFAGPWASAIGEAAGFRALSNAESPGSGLYLSWTIKADNTQDAITDRITVGFQTPTDAYLVRLEPFPFQPGPRSFRPLASTGIFTLPDTTNANAAPAWVGARARVFTAGSDWTVQLHVPVRSGAPAINASGIQLISPFKFFFEIRVLMMGGGPYVLTHPDTATGNNPASWDDATIGGTGCGKVVSLDGSSIRTTNNPANKVKFGSGQVNTLVADARNDTDTDPIAAGAIRTRFSVANWGSIPTDRNNATNLWAEIPPPGGVPGQNANPITKGTSGPVTQNWVVQDPFLSDFQNGLRWDHQCILCELSGGGITFSPSSASNNFQFATASKFRQDAQISVRGLPDPGTPERDVYLLVSTTNMPARVDPRPPPRPDWGKESPGIARRAATGENDGQGDDGEPQYDPTVTDLSGFDLVRRDDPTYVVHVFHDSGQTDPETGLPVLVPQTPFGYAVDHSGELHGWRHELSGATLTEVGPNLYRIRVATGGEAVITTEIEALERPDSWWERLLRWLLRLVRRFLRWLIGLLRR